MILQSLRDLEAEKQLLSEREGSLQRRIAELAKERAEEISSLRAESADELQKLRSRHEIENRLRSEEAEALVQNFTDLNARFGKLISEKEEEITTLREQHQSLQEEAALS